MTSTGSFASFDEFYRSQNRRLFHYFRRRVGREEAPDLVQQAFTGMLRCGAFERVENPEAYLFRAARNLVINQAREETASERCLWGCSVRAEIGADWPPKRAFQCASSSVRRT